MDSYYSKNENSIPDSGSQGLSKDLSILLNILCAAYAHLFLVLDDIEFYEKQKTSIVKESVDVQ